MSINAPSPKSYGESLRQAEDEEYARASPGRQRYLMERWGRVGRPSDAYAASEVQPQPTKTLEEYKDEYRELLKSLA